MSRIQNFLNAPPINKDSEDYLAGANDLLEELKEIFRELGAEDCSEIIEILEEEGLLESATEDCGCS